MLSKSATAKHKARGFKLKTRKAAHTRKGIRLGVRMGPITRKKNPRRFAPSMIQLEGMIKRKTALENWKRQAALKYGKNWTRNDLTEHERAVLDSLAGKHYRKGNPMQRNTRKWIEARTRLLAQLLNMPLGLERNNPGDYARYTITNPSQSHNYSPSLKAGEMDIWLSGAIAVARGEFK